MSKTSTNIENGNQSIEVLQSRYEELSHERTRVEERRATAQSQLEALRKQALEQFGTDDVKQLEEQLGQLRTENESKRRQYQDDLDKIDARLEEVHAKHSESEQKGDH